MGGSLTRGKRVASNFTADDGQGLIIGARGTAEGARPAARRVAAASSLIIGLAASCLGSRILSSLFKLLCIAHVSCVPAAATSHRLYLALARRSAMHIIVCVVWLCVCACALASPAQVVLQQPGASHPPSGPSRALPRGELEILSTTDTHGWLRGHLGANVPEPNASGDFGDLYSFVTRVRELDTDRDVLLVDSGDTVDGNGLVDADPGVKGHLAREVIAHMPYDLLTVGNRASLRLRAI